MQAKRLQTLFACTVPTSAIPAVMAEVFCKHLCSLVTFAVLDFLSSAICIYTLLTQVTECQVHQKMYSHVTDFFSYHNIQLACMMHVCLNQI